MRCSPSFDKNVNPTLAFMDKLEPHEHTDLYGVIFGFVIWPPGQLMNPCRYEREHHHANTTGLELISKIFTSSPHNDRGGVQRELILINGTINLG